MGKSLLSLLGDPLGLRHADTAAWTREQRPLCYAVCAVYLAFVCLGGAVMKRRPARRLDGCLAAWNTALAVLSALGASVTLTELYQAVQRFGLRGSWCQRGGYFDGLSGTAAFVLLLSKVVELGDTVFLVLRKRPLIFLHWYHHLSVLLWTWIAWPGGAAAMRWAIAANYSVHTVMYAYFAVRASGRRLPRALATAITCLQMAQFVLALYITLDVVLVVLVRGEPAECPDNPPWDVVVQAGLYATYLLLFAVFFRRAYCSRTQAKAKDH